MSDERIAAAIFVKTPGYSSLKTRLAAGVGTSAAEEFHRRAICCLQETLTQTAHQLISRGITLTPLWAVAEESAHNHPLWSGFETIGQGTGKLGNRMHHVYRLLLDRYDAVLLLGADSPQMSSLVLAQAIETLEAHAFVLGPSNDGGFSLLGGRRPIPLSVWQRVPYSVPETIGCLTKELSALGDVVHTETLVDVDVAEDLPLVLPLLRAFPPHSAQYQLAEWMERQLKTEC